MLVYYSMIGWTALMGIAASIFRNDTLKKVKVPWVYCILTFGYFIFWAGIRTGYIDTATYILHFNSVSESLHEIPKLWISQVKAPGFDTFNVLFKHFISDDYHVWFMVIALASGVPIMCVLRKYSTNFFYSAFLFVVTLNITWMLNGIRQFLVVAILFGACGWIERNEWKKYMLLIFLLSTIHYTALIMIPLYFITQGKAWNKKTLFLICLALLVMLFTNPFISGLESLLEGTTYEGATAQFAYDDGVHPLRVLVAMVPPILAYAGRKSLERYNDRYINICVNMSIMSACIYFIGMFTSGILIGRLPIYCELYNLILLPYVLDKCCTLKTKRFLYIASVIGYFLFFYTQSGGLYYISDLTGLLS